MDEAITVYESNIADWADTPYPYKRLRIIYTKRKQYDDAIRVCQKYIDIVKELQAHGFAREWGGGTIREYSEWTAKLEKKKAR